MLRSTSNGFKRRNHCSRALLKTKGSRSWAVFMIWRPARLASCLKFVSAQTYRGQPIRIKADIIVLNNWCACMKHSGRRHVVAWGEAWQTRARLFLAFQLGGAAAAIRSLLKSTRRQHLDQPKAQSAAGVSARRPPLKTAFGGTNHHHGPCDPSLR